MSPHSFYRLAARVNNAHAPQIPLVDSQFLCKFQVAKLSLELDTFYSLEIVFDNGAKDFFERGLEHGLQRSR